MPKKKIEVHPIVPADPHRPLANLFGRKLTMGVRPPVKTVNAQELLARARRINGKITPGHLRAFFGSINWEGIQAVFLASSQILFVPNVHSEKFLEMVKSGEILELTKKVWREQKDARKKSNAAPVISSEHRLPKITDLKEIGGRKSYSSVRFAIRHRLLKSPVIHPASLALLMGISPEGVQRLLQSGQLKMASSTMVDFNSVRKLFGLKSK